MPIADAVGLPIRVFHLLSNPVHASFGTNAAGTDTAVTLKALSAAMKVAGIRQGHVISEASPIITHPAWCAAVVDGADCRSMVNASVSAAIGSGALVLVAYGAQASLLRRRAPAQPGCEAAPGVAGGWADRVRRGEER